MIGYEALLNGAERKASMYSPVLEAKQSPTWKGLRSKPDLSRKRPDSNHLNHDTAHTSITLSNLSITLLF